MEKVKQDNPFRKRWTEIKKNGLIFNLLGLIPMVWSIVLVLLIIWGINVTFADPDWYLRNNNSFLTKEFTLRNFLDAFQKLKVEVSDPGAGVRAVGFGEMLFNSVWYSIGATFMKMLSTVLFAYAVARFEFPGRKLLYGTLLLQMMLPLYGTMAANYEIYQQLGILNSPLYILALGAGHGTFFMITYSFFRNLPSGYEEAARIDGANAFQVFFHVMLPLAKSIVVALAIMQFIGCWNDYQHVIVYISSYPTLSAALYLVKEKAFILGLQTPAYFAAIFITVLPVAIIFIAFNKKIMENVTLGGLKG